MRSFTFIEELESADSVVGLANRLGKLCMDHAGELQRALDDPPHRQLGKAITDRVGDLGPDDWERLIDEPENLGAHLDDELAGLLGSADPHYPLDCLAILRGLCRGALATFYETTEGSVPLDRGAPVPLATRPLAGGPEFTPAPATIGRGGLLFGFGHRLFEYPEDDGVRVVLDFAQRKRLDQVAWSKAQRLPRVATIHPAGCGELDFETNSRDAFFDASPTCWDLEAVLALLKRVADVEMVVLPELSLPRPDALHAALLESPESYPPLVVAGSAHLREGANDGTEVRANETQIYLDGQLVARHRKCNPYTATKLGPGRLPSPLQEAITREQKTITVLSGEHTRFAVVICADLIHEYIPQKLVSAGVNTLLVPSFTPKRGSFSAPIGSIASLRQGIAVIANAPPRGSVRPFHGMVAVPHPGPEGQSAIYPRDSETPTEVAVFDPNQRLEKAVTWR